MVRRESELGSLENDLRDVANHEHNKAPHRQDINLIAALFPRPMNAPRRLLGASCEALGELQIGSHASSHEARQDRHHMDIRRKKVMP